MRISSDAAMADPRFFASPTAISLADIAALTGARLGRAADPSALIGGAAALEEAGPGDICFLEHARLLPALARSKATACFCPADLADRLPAGLAALEAAKPGEAFALAVGLLYPDARRPLGITGMSGRSAAAQIDPTARLEDNVAVEAGAIVGPAAEIGRGTRIAALAVIGPNVRVGRECSVGPGASIQHALIGDRVIIHPGARIGQDGFGFVPGPNGHAKIPQIGRVIIQNDVEIGANSCIDRGSIRDTVVGEGTKVDNLVQIAHNVVIGRHCLIAGQVGISGSVVLGDFVAIGGGAGISDHLTIGDGARLAASAGLMHDIPAGARWGGTPARPLRDYFRMTKALERLAFPQGKREPRPAAGGSGPNDSGGAE
jgi:UDP-3-O-[3-hydroxymyristoyl] glucosamine N-acyltransferase